MNLRVLEYGHSLKAAITVVIEPSFARSRKQVVEH
jgi:hypothetical protein